MELSNLPNEVLTEILIYLSDTTLLNMTKVSKHFRAIAKESFKKKYNGRNSDAHFEIQLFYDNILGERKQYQPFFCTFGENLVALSIQFDDGSVNSNHWLYTLIARYCTKLQSIEIFGADDIELSKILHPQLASSLRYLKLECVGLINELATCQFPNLVTLHFTDVTMSAQQFLLDFITINPQLEDISFMSCEVNEVNCYLPFLKEVKSSCNNIHTLKLVEYGGRIVIWDSEMGHEILRILCKFITLQSLTLDSKHLKLNLLVTIIKHLPNLSHLGLTCCTTPEHFVHVFAVCRHVPRITIDRLPLMSFYILTLTANRMQSERTIRLNWCEDSDSYEILITKGMVQCNGSVMYKDDTIDVDYKQQPLQQRKNLLDLNDECLNRIFDSLTPRSLFALYATCKRIPRIRAAIGTYYSKNIIRVPFKFEYWIESMFRCLGSQIQSLELNSMFCLSTQNERQLLLTHINQCCTNLKELRIYICGDLQVQTNVWPILKVLKFSAEVFHDRCNRLAESAISYDTLRAFVCPTLTHLEILDLYLVHNMVQRLDHGDNFRCLTVLKFGDYHAAVKIFLESLDRNVCEQITELSIGAHLPLETEVDYNGDLIQGFSGKPNKSIIELIHIVSRFRSLTTLYLVVRGIDCCDSKYLFENCTKLVTFGFWCWGGIRTRSMLVQVLKNCQYLRKVRLFGPGVFRDILQLLRRFVSVEVAIQNNVAFSVTDDNPCYNEMIVSIPGN